VAAWVLDMFRYLYLVKNQTVVNNSTTPGATEKKLAQIWNP